MTLTIDQALKQGVEAHNQGNLQDAERLYRAILQSRPTHPDANHNLGLIAVTVNQPAAALPLFKLALEENPKIEQFWLSYIDALINEKQFDNARRVLKKGKKQGVDREKLSIMEKQLISIHQTKNIDSASPSQAKLSSLLEHYQNGRYDDAEKLARSLSIQFPCHNFSWKILGAVLKQTGRASEAVFAGQKTVEITPDDAEAHSNLGNTFQELSRFEEAIESYTQAISLKPDNAESYNNLGVMFQKLRRLEEAGDSFERAIALKPNFKEAHNNLGITLRKLSRWGASEASSRKAIALDADFSPAHRGLGMALFHQGFFDLVYLNHFSISCQMRFSQMRNMKVNELLLKTPS